MTIKRFFVFAHMMVLSAIWSPAWADVTVVATIKPIHSLVAAVMQGVGAPHLIVKGPGSPHAYSLKPSDAKALQQAELVFWVGPGLETFLQNSLKVLSVQARIVTLADIAEIERIRLSGKEDKEDDDERAHDGHAHAMGAYDPHIWLNPSNAIAIVRAAAEALSVVDPEHRGIYEKNAAIVERKIIDMESGLKAQLETLQGRPFIVFHDAYSHFERHFNIPAVMAITVSPEKPPGAGRLAQIRKRISELGSVCVFAEPQFSPKLVRLLTEGTAAKSAQLDPLGVTLDAGPEQYVQLMRQLAGSLHLCLSR